MRTSSTAAQTSDFEVPSDQRRSYNPTEESRAGGSKHTTEMMDLPKFDAKLYAATSRIAGRINAASASDEEFEKLLRERQRLLDKKYAGDASRSDLNRLEYVRWSLERIEDAKYGHDFEQLESAVVSYEKLLTEIHQLNSTLSARKSGNRR